MFKKLLYQMLGPIRNMDGSGKTWSIQMMLGPIRNMENPKEILARGRPGLYKLIYQNVSILINKEKMYAWRK
jgi:hypothetical protein